MVKVSVVIPVYNVEKYLRDCLDTIVNQTLEDIEIICVNDGSTDKSLDILNEYASKDERMRVISQENGGHAVATNVGMTYATGEYLFLMDSDDILKLKSIGVKDSKKLSTKEIFSLYKKIEKLNITYEVIVLKPFSYNKLYTKFTNENKNLNHLLAHLHYKVINQLLTKINTTDVLVIIDKFDYKKMNQYLDINPKIDVIQETNGEKYIPVATSSIIAKYYYEKTLKEIEERYNINRKIKPKNIEKDIIDKVAKTHFKNIKPYT